MGGGLGDGPGQLRNSEMIMYLETGSLAGDGPFDLLKMRDSQARSTQECMVGLLAKERMLFLRGQYRSEEARMPVQLPLADRPEAQRGTARPPRPRPQPSNRHTWQRTLAGRPSPRPPTMPVPYATRTHTDAEAPQQHDSV